MKSSTLITRDGGTVVVYFQDSYTDVVMYNDDLNMHTINNDLNMANEVAWLAENQAALKHKKVLEDKVRFEAEKESLDKNAVLLREVMDRQMQVEANKRLALNGYSEGPIARLK